MGQEGQLEAEVAVMVAENEVEAPRQELHGAEVAAEVEAEEDDEGLKEAVMVEVEAPCQGLKAEIEDEVEVT